jgi:general secretion pathway protein C
MGIYFKRYFWIVPLVTTMLCSYLAARAATAVADAKLSDDEAAPKMAAPRRPRPVTPVKPTAGKDADVVIARNMFCSTCDPPVVVKDSAKPADDPNHTPITSLPLLLSATVVASRAEFSAATIINTQSFKSGSYGVDDEIPDAGTIVTIKPKYVDFRNKTSSRLERVELGGTSAPPAVAVAAPPPTPPPASEPGNPEAELASAVDKGVKRVDDTHYEIDRALVDKILGDPSTVMRQARIVPSIVNGKPNGFKMYAIRPNSVFAKIGMQNGDTISSINGFDMTSPDKALEVYTKVRSASALSISLVRRGQPVAMEYSIK